MSDETDTAETDATDDNIDEKVSEMIPTKEIIQQIDNPPPSQEDIDKKQNIIFKIQKYQDSRRFGHIVKEQLKFNQTFDELNEMTIENLENIVSRIRIHLDNKNLDRFYDNMAKSVAMVYEQLVSQVYDIDGFTDLLVENEEFWWTFERFKIENNFPAVNSTSQMLYMIGQATIMAHHMPREYDDSPMEVPPSADEVIASISNSEPLPTIPENKPLDIVDKEPLPTTEHKNEHLSIGSSF